jgi:protein-S-isoprenylcysteine O-methyltransferase Ste14
MERVPPFVSGCWLLVYWGSVAIKAHRAKRWEHGANIIPPEPIGRWLRLVWVPLVIVWCVQPWLAFFGRTGEFGTARFWQITGWIGAAVCIFATAATFVCWRTMGKSWRIGIDPAEKTVLVRTGSFRIVRHPIYSLSILLMIGTLATTRTWLMLVTAIVHVALLQFEASREETYLLQKHGDEYARYRRATGRFLPRLRFAK